MTTNNHDTLTNLARDGVRRIPWRTVAIGTAGASAIGLLGAAGLAPLLLAIMGKEIAAGTVAAWLTTIGGNALAGWLGDLALRAAGTPLASDDPAEAQAAQQDLARQLDTLLKSNRAAAADLARLLAAIDAVPTSLEALHEEVGAQSDLLLNLHADMTRLGLASDALGDALVQEADRVIATLAAHADRSDATLDTMLTALQALRDKQPPALVNFGQQNQFRDVTIDAVAGRDVIKVTIHQIIHNSPLPYRTAVERMTEDYSAVFGGRDTELAQLDRWLRTDQRPCAFLHAPTGRGKTALLLHWVAQVQQRGDWYVVFVPISLRYQTHTAASALGALATALAAFHDELAQLNVTNTAPDQLRPLIAEYLRRPSKDKRRLLVVLDGLDEATGWEVARDLFPRTPGPHMRLVASARECAHLTLRNWLERLGWMPELTCDLGLDGLNQAAVSDVLRRMGNPLDALATHVDLLGEIARVSQGDPLTIRHLVEALTDGSLTPGRLQALTPGLAAFVRAWLDELERHSSSTDAIYTLLRLCAVALGPLTSDDLQRLAPDMFARKSALNQAAKQVGRFVIGDGSSERGYVFGHPRLRELYLEDILFDAERKTAQHCFVEDGRRWYATRPGTLPAYLRQFWITHLTQSAAWIEACTVVTGVEQTASGYRQAWAEWHYAAEGSYSGYLSDLDRIWQHAEAVGDLALAVRCALIAATIRSLSGNIAPDLLYQLVTVGTLDGKWSIAAALETMRQMPDSWQQAAALKQLAPLIPDHALPLALDVVQAITDEWACVEALAALAPHLAGDLLMAALAVAQSITDEWSRAYALMALAPQLTGDLLAAALDAARAITQEWERLKVLAALVPQLPPIEQQTILREILDSAHTIATDRERVNMLVRLVPRLPASEQPAILAEALDLTRIFPEEGFRAEVLVVLAPQLTGNCLKEALGDAWAIIDPQKRFNVLVALAPQLPPMEQQAVLSAALEAAQSITDAQKRVYALVVLAPYLSPSERQTVLAVALEASRSIPDPWKRAQALAALAPQLSLAERQVVLVEVLETERAIADDWKRGHTLAVLAPHLTDNLLVAALDVIQSIATDTNRAKALIALTPQLTGDVLVAVLDVVQSLTDEEERADVLAALAPQLTGDLLSSAREVAESIATGRERARVLVALARQLSASERQPMLAEALDAARSINDVWERANILAALAPQLPASEQQAVLVEALDAARAIADAEKRASALTTLAQQLPLAERQIVLVEALDAARAIADAEERASTLMALAQQLPLAERQVVLVEVLNTVQTIPYDQLCAALLVQLVPNLVEDVLALALNAAWSITAVPERARVLSVLAPRLSGDLLATALDMAHATPAAKHRTCALAALAPQLPVCERPSVLAAALDSARAISNERERAEALVALAPQLMGDLLAVALAMTQAITDERVRAKVLAGLAPQLTGDLLVATLDAAQAIPTERERADVLVALIPQLPVSERHDVLVAVLDAARTIPEEPGRARVLVALAPQLTGDLLITALDMAHATTAAEYRAYALNALAPQLPLGEQQAVLMAMFDAAWSIPDKWQRAYALNALAPQLPVSEQQAALVEVLNMERTVLDDCSYARALVRLAPRLRGTVLKNELEEVLFLDEDDGRTEALAALADPLATQRIPVSVWVATLRTLVQRGRPGLLSDLAALMPWLLSVTTPEQRVEIAQAVTDVCRGWP